mmetsp:Transcript_28831/g.21471  ORF Transcript_28831/g.21471 Transcript_28831/m.21471 type:complete len:192 (+) Transcript_28831:15-590(+)
MGEEIVEDLDDDAYISVELVQNSTMISVRKKRILLSSIYKSLTRPSKSSSRSSSASKKRDKKHKAKKEGTHKVKKLKWVLPGIVVRVTSKKVEEGKLYNQKLRILDVLTENKFLAVPLENAKRAQEFTDLKEKHLETVLPKETDSEVLVLKGRCRGEVGKIISRDKKKQQLVVQVGLDIETLGFDDCAMRA